MKSCFSFFLFFLLSFQPNANIEIDINDADLIIKRTSLQSGASFVMKNLSQDDVTACSYSRCQKISNSWEFFGIKIREETTHRLFIFIKNKGWAFLDLPLEKSLYSTTKPSKLRLPTSVQENLENNKEQIQIESEYNKKILTQSRHDTLGCQWKQPLKSKTVSQFSSVRTLPNGYTYPHTGLDFRATTFTPIQAVGDGVVLSTDDQVVGGKTINIDHGKGVISRYLHLSEFRVGIGQGVQSGQIIALSGSTGRVEAPHLHWEMRVHGIAVDPISTLALLKQICDQG
ncbi:MAG: M23 family metallopeptidase [Oligoflexia bacterium]|nr:M23 family metallopeptidase [Oligoflexia bacterium]